MGQEIQQMFMEGMSSDRLPIAPLLDFVTNIVQSTPQTQEQLQARPYIEMWQAYEADRLFQELDAAKERLPKEFLIDVEINTHLT